MGGAFSHRAPSRTTPLNRWSSAAYPTSGPMPIEELTDRLTRQPVHIECPICRHSQRLSATVGRCDQCGSEFSVFPDRERAQEQLDGLIATGRVAYLREAAGGLFVLVANRSFGKRA